MGDPLADALTGILTQAESKFANHINVIKRRIDSGIEEYFSDDNIIDRLAEDEEVEFTEDGILWNS
jgi:hypothetical protein